MNEIQVITTNPTCVVLYILLATLMIITIINVRQLVINTKISERTAKICAVAIIVLFGSSLLVTSFYVIDYIDLYIDTKQNILRVAETNEEYTGNYKIIEDQHTNVAYYDNRRRILYIPKSNNQ